MLHAVKSQSAALILKVPLLVILASQVPSHNDPSLEFLNDLSER